MNKSAIVAFLSLLSSACETWPVLDSSSRDASLDPASNPSDGSPSDMSESYWTDTFNTKASKLTLETSTTFWSVGSEMSSSLAAVIGEWPLCPDTKPSIAFQDVGGQSATATATAVGIFKEPILGEIRTGTITIEYLFTEPMGPTKSTLAVSIGLLDSHLEQIQPVPTQGSLPLIINNQAMLTSQEFKFSLIEKTLVRGIRLNVALNRKDRTSGSCVRIYKLNLTLR